MSVPPTVPGWRSESLAWVTVRWRLAQENGKVYDKYILLEPLVVESAATASITAPVPLVAFGSGALDQSSVETRGGWLILERWWTLLTY